MNPLPPPPPPPRRPRRARYIALLLGVILLAIVARWATSIRQSGVRAFTQAKLHAVAQAVAVYQNQHAVPPGTLDDLLKAGLVDPPSLKEFSRCAPATPGTPVLDAWLVQTTPCRAVRKGEAWNGPGETIDHDLPACRYVLMKDWTVVQIDEPEYAQKYKPHVTLTPLK